jgi:hypothetical protein
MAKPRDKKSVHIRGCFGPLIKHSLVQILSPRTKFNIQYGQCRDQRPPCSIGIEQRRDLRPPISGTSHCRKNMIVVIGAKRTAGPELWIC